jgi:hypothetical protein
MSDLKELCELIDAVDDSVTIATGGMLTDYADILVRGYLKEHPALVAYRLDVITAVIEIVRQQVDHELATKPDWGPCGTAEAAADHLERVAEYVEHTCTCEWCRHQLPDLACT